MPQLPLPLPEPGEPPDESLEASVAQLVSLHRAAGTLLEYLDHRPDPNRERIDALNHAVRDLAAPAGTGRFGYMLRRLAAQPIHDHAGYHAALEDLDIARRGPATDESAG